MVNVELAKLGPNTIGAATAVVPVAAALLPFDNIDVPPSNVSVFEVPTPIVVVKLPDALFTASDPTVMGCPRSMVRLPVAAGIVAAAPVLFGKGGDDQFPS